MPITIHLPADIAPRKKSERLSVAQLKSISLFQGLAKLDDDLYGFPGTTLLHYFEPGEAICRQNEAGWTAFYVLTTEDALKVREESLRMAREKKGGESRTTLKQWDHRIQVLEKECERLRSAIQKIEGEAAAKSSPENPASGLPLRAAAKVDIGLQRLEGVRPSFWQRFVQRLAGSSATPAEELPASIPCDAQQEYDTRKGLIISEGDLFGEMSCINRDPRAATVTAVRGCYVLEMLRNILDRLQQDKSYRAKADNVYKQRVLEGHLRRLPCFAKLDAETFKWLQSQCELVTFEPGTVMFSEHEPSDDLYVVRRGLVKVMKNTQWVIREQDIGADRWRWLGEELKSCEADFANKKDPQVGNPLRAKVWELLPADVQQALPVVDEAQRPAVITALNGIVRNEAISAAAGKKTKNLVDAIENTPLLQFVERQRDSVDSWTQADQYDFNRLLLSAICPAGLPDWSRAPRRNLAYLGQGEFIGEMGVFRGEPRSASCVAFNHVDQGQADPYTKKGALPPRVELVRIRLATYQELARRSADFGREVEHVCKLRYAQEHNTNVNEQPITLNPEFEQQGLIQGQQLMVINLDRCTRCGDCMQACINTHADGRSRLYLEGNRIGNLLIPNTCRRCIDPVCMVGCPVGSIIKGDGQEIQIKSWCIGCSYCANQCPYGSIQMHPLGNLDTYPDRGKIESVTPPELFDVTPEEEAIEEAKRNKQKKITVREAEPQADEGDAYGEDDSLDISAVTRRAVVCDLCQSLPSREPACVVHCPHNAAFRIDARFEHFPGYEV